MKKHITLLAFTFCLIYLVPAQDRQKVDTSGQRGYKIFLYIGGSGTLWYRSEQPLMNTYKRPWQVYMDFSMKKSVWGLRTGITFRQGYKQDFVIINSNSAFLALQLTTRNILKRRYEFFTYAGPNLWYSSLYFDNTTYKETDLGVGFDAGLGVNYHLGKKTLLGIDFAYTSSARGAYFYAGALNKQNVGTGGFVLLLTLSYNVL